MAIDGRSDGPCSDKAEEPEQPNELNTCPKCKTVGVRRGGGLFEILHGGSVFYECPKCGKMWIISDEINMEKLVNTVIYGKYESKKEKEQEEEWNLDEYEEG
jgi:Zn-finger nucleic acid-binding protein